VIRPSAFLFLLLLAGHTHAGEQLDILVYGATGKIGTHVVDEALNRGHRVTAVSRDPARIAAVHENLVPKQGDLLDPGSIETLIEGCDVVVISVRGVVGELIGENALQRIAIENVVEAVRRIGGQGPRVIHVGGSGTLEVRPGVLYADTIPKSFIRKSLEAEIQGQILALEYLRAIDDVDWTYITPPKRFTDRKRTGTYRIGGDKIMKNERGRSRISRADFAVAVVDEAENAAHVRKRFAVVN
jgi:putative NADH-flavin reductase